jgi:hypothetical protein
MDFGAHRIDFDNDRKCHGVELTPIAIADGSTDVAMRSRPSLTVRPAAR